MSEIYVYWLVVSLVILAIFIALGIKISGRYLGILIDSRNKMSLARLQLVLWSWLLISVFFAIAVAEGTTDIVMPPEIWALMGISVGSTTGALLVKSRKIEQEPDQQKMGAVATLTAQEGSRQGLLQTNADPDDASLADLFKGEEITDHPYVDISKVQMFLFTIAMVGGYATVLWKWDIPTSGIELPALSEQMVTILGISHAGYLGMKAAPKTPVA